MYATKGLPTSVTLADIPNGEETNPLRAICRVRPPYRGENTGAAEGERAFAPGAWRNWWKCPAHQDRVRRTEAAT